MMAATTIVTSQGDFDFIGGLRQRSAWVTDQRLNMGRLHLARSALAGHCSMEASGLGLMADRFDVVPVRANDESCIVVRVIVGAQTRRTIVFATCLQGRAMESFDLLAIIGHLQPVEFICLVGLGLTAAFCISLVVTLLPILAKVDEPGSGGGAQMVVGLFFGPIAIGSGIVAFLCIIGVVAILRTGRKREPKNEQQHRN